MPRRDPDSDRGLLPRDDPALGILRVVLTARVRHEARTVGNAVTDAEVMGWVRDELRDFSIVARPEHGSTLTSDTFKFVGKTTVFTALLFDHLRMGAQNRPAGFRFEYSQRLPVETLDRLSEIGHRPSPGSYDLHLLLEPSEWRYWEFAYSLAADARMKTFGIGARMLIDEAVKH